jgi:hypothetical protein
MPRVERENAAIRAANSCLYSRSDHKDYTNRAAPVCGFHGASLPDPLANLPGPGKYKWGEAKDYIRPQNAPISMKFRSGRPEDKTRRPAPNAYSPTDPLKMYKGAYTKVTIKLRYALALDVYLLHALHPYLRRHRPEL